VKAAALVLAAMVMANVVAAGVMQLLGAIALEAQDETAQVVGVTLAGLLSIAASILFLKGCLRAVIEATTMPGTPARGIGRPHGAK